MSAVVKSWAETYKRYKLEAIYEGISGLSRGAYAL